MENVIRDDESVSIILPTYNRERLLGAAIESVLSQTYPYFELLIVDDGSTDGTESLVKGYSDERISYYRMQENGGQSKARNYGIKKAKYQYLAFEDSDDIWYPDKLEKQMKAMLSAPEGVGIVYHKVKYETEEYGTVIVPSEQIPIEKKNGDIFEQLLRGNMIGMPTILVKRKCIDEVGVLNESFKCLEDYEWFLRITLKYKVLFLDEVLLDAGCSDLGVSSNLNNHIVANCQIVQLYKEDLLRTNLFNYKLESILSSAQNIGVLDQTVALLEKMLQQG